MDFNGLNWCFWVCMAKGEGTKKIAPGVGAIFLLGSG